MDTLRTLVTRAERAASVLAALTLLAVLAVVACDVLLRYAFARPLTWSYDLISMYLMPAGFFFAASNTFREGHHVAVDVFAQRMPRRARRAAALLGCLLVIPVFGAIAWLSARTALHAWRNAEVVSGAVAWPTWPPAAVCAAGLALLVVRLALECVAQAWSLRRDAGALPDAGVAEDPVERGARG